MEHDTPWGILSDHDADVLIGRLEAQLAKSRNENRDVLACIANLERKLVKSHPSPLAHVAPQESECSDSECEYEPQLGSYSHGRLLHGQRSRVRIPSVDDVSPTHGCEKIQNAGEFKGHQTKQITNHACDPLVAPVESEDDEPDPEVHEGQTKPIDKSNQGSWMNSPLIASQNKDSFCQIGVEGDDHMVALEFSFVVPECEGGRKIQVEAPDGVMLVVTLPKNGQPGDTVVMTRADEGSTWSFQHLMRPDPQPLHTSPPSTLGQEKRFRAEPPHTSLPPTLGQERWLSAEKLHSDLVESSVGVTLSTTKGDVRLLIVPEWSPRGAQRFLEMIDDGFYSKQIAIYRAVPDFLVQFGVVHGDQPYDAILDDPLIGVPVEVGSIVFAAGGSDSRRHTVCIFINAFPQLGKASFQTPIGKVADAASMETVKSLFTGYGDIPQAGGQGPDPLILQEKGNSYILNNFPSCDFITSAERGQPLPDPDSRQKSRKMNHGELHETQTEPIDELHPALAPGTSDRDQMVHEVHKGHAKSSAASHQVSWMNSPLFAPGSGKMNHGDMRETQTGPIDELHPSLAPGKSDEDQPVHEVHEGQTKPLAESRQGSWMNSPLFAPGSGKMNHGDMHEAQTGPVDEVYPSLAPGKSDDDQPVHEVHEGQTKPTAESHQGSWMNGSLSEPEKPEGESW